MFALFWEKPPLNSHIDPKNNSVSERDRCHGVVTLTFIFLFTIRIVYCRIDLLTVIHPIQVVTESIYVIELNLPVFFSHRTLFSPVAFKLLH